MYLCAVMDASSWPWGSSHLRLWTFSRSELLRQKNEVYDATVQKIKQVNFGTTIKKAALQTAEADMTQNGNNSTAKKIENDETKSIRPEVSKESKLRIPPSTQCDRLVLSASPSAQNSIVNEEFDDLYIPPLDDLECLLVYFLMQMLHLFRKKGLTASVLAVCCTFFHRFFFKQSPLVYDAREVLFACLILSLKACDVARHMTIGELLGDFDDLSISSVLALELPVSQTLGFHYSILGFSEPLNDFISQVAAYMKSIFDQDVLPIREYILKQREKTDNSDNEAGNTGQKAGKCEVSLVSTENNKSLDAKLFGSLDEAVDELLRIEAEQLRRNNLLMDLHESVEVDCLLLCTDPKLCLCEPPSALAFAAVVFSPFIQKLRILGIDVIQILKQNILNQQTSCSSNDNNRESVERSKIPGDYRTVEQTRCKSAIQNGKGAEGGKPEGLGSFSEINSECAFDALMTGAKEIANELERLKKVYREIHSSIVAQKVAGILERTMDASDRLKRRGDDRRERKRKKKKLKH